MEGAADGGRVRVERVVDVVAGVALVVAVAVTFAPWLRSGEARRDSHELVRTAERLGVFEGTAALLVRVGWAFLPFLAAVGVLALVRGRRPVGLAAGAAVGAVLLVVGLGLQVAGPLADWGATVAIGVGIVLVATGAVGFIADRGGRQRR